MSQTVKLVPATPTDFAVIQNMVQFYIYEFSGYLANEESFKLNNQGVYAALETLLLYWQEPGRHAFLIRVDDELASFILINQVGSSPEVNWNMGEFFIMRKFQKQGIDKYIAYQCFDRFPGIWEVMVIPENSAACPFWKSVIKNYASKKDFQEDKKPIAAKNNEERIIFKFTVSPG